MINSMIQQIFNDQNKRFHNCEAIFPIEGVLVIDHPKIQIIILLNDNIAIFDNVKELNQDYNP